MTKRYTSLPTRGGWIEIRSCRRSAGSVYRPSPHGEGGLKFMMQRRKSRNMQSLPTRGGWIEMPITIMRRAEVMVPPHTGRVD